MSANTKTEATVKPSVLHVQDVPPEMLRDIGVVARMQGLTIKELVKRLLAEEIERVIPRSAERKAKK